MKALLFSGVLFLTSMAAQAQSYMCTTPNYLNEYELKSTAPGKQFIFNDGVHWLSVVLPEESFLDNPAVDADGYTERYRYQDEAFNIVMWGKSVPSDTGGKTYYYYTVSGSPYAAFNGTWAWNYDNQIFANNYEIYNGFACSALVAR